MKHITDYVIDYKKDSNDELQFKVNNKEGAFEVFCENYDIMYGSLNIEDNLIEIHTGGWSENEYLVSSLQKTAWWLSINYIYQSGGHYYIDTDAHNEDKKHWVIIKK